MDSERQRSGWSADGPRGRLATPFDSNFTGVGQLLPSRLVRIQHLPWLSLWESQLRAEKKSNHTIRAYLSAARRFGMTLLPGEEEVDIEEMPISEMHDRCDPNNGRLDLFVQSISNLRPSTINARIAAIGHLFIQSKELGWMGIVAMVALVVVGIIASSFLAGQQDKDEDDVLQINQCNHCDDTHPTQFFALMNISIVSSSSSS